jgi:seryl-tRNA synthetase
MIDRRLIRENPERVRVAMRNRGVDVDIDELVRLDGQWRHVLQELEDARAEHKQATAAAATDPKQREALRGSKDRIKALEIRISELEITLDKLVGALPNMPREDTPVGTDASANVVIREVGSKATFPFEPRHYLEIAEGLGIIDVTSAAKVSGSRFGYLLGGAARLEFALVQFALDRLTDGPFVAALIERERLGVAPAPFRPVVPPVLIRPEMMRAMGFSERAGASRGSDEIYWLDKDGLYLVGTSEQSIGPMHADRILRADELPLRYASFSTCFRREAGAAGKDTKGILRVHQFDKLELFTVCAPDVSEKEHRLIVAIEETLMQELGLHYRLVQLSTGDMGAAAASTFDIETWMPGQGEYRETHSASNTTDYQARGLQTRFRDADGTVAPVHMLNGTAVAVGRMLIAIIENYQTADGTVTVPDALRPYLGGLTEITG